MDSLADHLRDIIPPGYQVLLYDRTNCRPPNYHLCVVRGLDPSWFIIYGYPDSSSLQLTVDVRWQNSSYSKKGIYYVVDPRSWDKLIRDLDDIVKNRQPRRNSCPD